MGYQYTRTDGTQAEVATIDALEAELRARLIEPDTVVLDTAANVRAKAAALIVFARKRAAAQPAPRPKPPSPWTPPSAPLDTTQEPGINKHRVAAVLIAFLAINITAGVGVVNPEFVGSATVYVLIAALVLVGILNIFLKRDTPARRARSWYLGSAIFSTLLVVTTVVVPLMFRGERDQSEKAAMKALAKAGKDGRDQIESIDKGGDRTPGKVAQAPKIASDDRSAMGKAAPLLQAMQLDLVKAYAEFKKFEDASGLDSYLGIPSLVTREGRQRNHDILAAYIEGLEKYERTRKEIQARHRGYMVVALGDGEFERGFMTGVDQSFDRGNKIQAELVALNHATLKGVDDLNTYLDSLNPGPVLQGGKITFSQQSQVDRFNQLLGVFTELGKKEEEIDKRQQEITKQAVERMERAAEKGLRNF